MISKEEIDSFQAMNHKELVALYNELMADKSCTRNDGIFKIMNSNLTELEKIVCAMNVAEKKALENQNTEALNLAKRLVNKIDPALLNDDEIKFNDYRKKK